MLFERLLIYENRAPVSAAMNMAIDEALLEHSAGPTLRFYGWRRPSLSFGYFGKFADLANEGRAREIVRRWTGGGSVLHGEDLTYSLVTPATDPASSQGPPAIYAALHRAIRVALLAEGRETELADVAAPKISDACFANPVRDDLLLAGRKIAGAAQRRTRGGFLHQGSIQLPNLSETFRDRFASALSAKIEHEEMPPEVLERAARLAAEKYETDAWLHRW
jgi:lipoate-protein ligase A